MKWMYCVILLLLGGAEVGMINAVCVLCAVFECS